MKKRISLAFLCLSGASLACSVFIGGTALPDPPIQGSPDALQTLQTDLAAAVQGMGADGTLRLSLTQEQLTAFLTSRLAADSHPLITEPQVELGDQEMIIYGRVQYWIIEANASVAAKFELDDAGRPQIRINHAELGPIPMPAPLKNGFAAMLDEMLTGYVGPLTIGFRLDSIDISDGRMALTGRLR